MYRWVSLLCPAIAKLDHHPVHLITVFFFFHHSFYAYIIFFFSIKIKLTISCSLCLSVTNLLFFCFFLCTLVSFSHCDLMSDDTVAFVQPKYFVCQLIGYVFNIFSLYLYFLIVSSYCILNETLNEEKNQTEKTKTDRLKWKITI